MKTGMKLFITFIASLILYACHSTTETPSGKIKPDTSRTLALYHLGDSIARVEFVYRVQKEIEKFTFNADSTVATKKVSFDSLYFVPHPDSAKAGKLSWAALPKPFILVDGGKNIDSLFKKYALRFASASNNDTIKK